MSLHSSEHVVSGELGLLWGRLDASLERSRVCVVDVGLDAELLETRTLLTARAELLRRLKDLERRLIAARSRRRSQRHRSQGRPPECVNFDAAGPLPLGRSQTYTSGLRRPKRRLINVPSPS